MNLNPNNRQHAEAELSRIGEAAERIFEGSPLLGEITALIGETRREIADAVGHRNIRATIVSVLGSKTSGKSWLCRSLVAHEESRNSIRVGMGSRNATQKLTWIGAESPEQLHEEFETRIKTPKDGLVDLGSSYLLLDVPGHNDVSEGARSAARKCLALAPLRVFVTTWDRHSEESHFHYLSDSDGTRILPVIVDSEYSREGQDYENALSDFVKRIERHCPNAEVCPPVVVPMIDNARNPEDAARVASELVRDALRRFIEGGSDVTPRVVAARVGIFKLRLRSLLEHFFERVEPHYRHLNQSEDAAVSKIIKQLLGSEKTLMAGVRMRLLMEVVLPVPVYFFPYRVLLTTMALAAGAIDRLILAFSGSLPSLAVVAFQTSRNLKRLQEMRTNASTALRERASELAKDELAEANDIFLRTIEQEINLGEHSKVRAAARETQLTGIGRIESGSSEIFDKALSNHAPSRWLPWIFGGIATLTFIGLGAAPAWSVYREFLVAWRTAFDGSSPSIWQDFPAPSGSMIFATLLLMVLPVAVLALATIALGVTSDRVKRCVASISSAHDKLRDELLRTRAIRITTKDPVRESVRILLDACPSDQSDQSEEPSDPDIH